MLYALSVKEVAFLLLKREKSSVLQLLWILKFRNLFQSPCIPLYAQNADIIPSLIQPSLSLYNIFKYKI